MHTITKITFSLFISILLVACETDTPAPQTVETQTTTNDQTDDQAQPQEKPKYSILENPLPVTTGDKIEVAELFWYGCGHCYALEPYVKTWLENKPDNAEFIKIPAIFSQNWAFHGQAYYTMEALDVLEEANDAYFNQIHVERNKINDLSGLVEFLNAYNKTEAEVTQAFNSVEVETKLRNAGTTTKASTARGVPAIVVDGKYLTSVGAAGGQEALFELVDELIEKAASER